MGIVDYNKIAGQYDRRYQLHDYPGTRSTILAAIERSGYPRVLEVGCGTGKWLAELASTGCDVAGVDPSREMLQRASAEVSGDLRQASAEALPWDDASFDLVFCINSFHHFSEPETALRETFRVLRPGGKFLSVGLDPHEKGGCWYVYEFFPETVGLDLERFPSRVRRTGWIEAVGFTDVVVRVAERLKFSRSFEQALRDGLLEQSFTSQLTALSFAQYSAGMQRIRDAARKDDTFRLEMDLALYATEARKPVGSIPLASNAK
jgi:ubiquinone/menaquinone biosynthesis C-methylase UbiE